MADIAAPTPWTTEKWLTGTPELPKEYFDIADQKWVRLHYNGNAKLSLWEKGTLTTSILSSGADGAPLTVPGDVSTEYTFTCNIEGGDIMLMHLIWDFGDGSEPQEAFQTNQMNHTWNTAGTFTISVQVRDIDTEELLGTAIDTAIIEVSVNYLDILHSMNKITVGLPSGSHHHCTDGTTLNESSIWIHSENWFIGYFFPLVWDGGNFSASGTTPTGSQISIQGYFSDDGQTLVNLHASEINNLKEENLVMINIPFFEYNQDNGVIEYMIEGLPAQSHVPEFEFKQAILNGWSVYSHSDWEYVSARVQFFVPFNLRKIRN